ncbi:uncharacterized protein ASCRUDRAFT_134647 [Ascoidea rubescens DSM 1968]|uniref:Uncharacterized protein n=1 Tax=Ascoidea rubescens DSM 1968 TaxID=1344418 RepID=A0A1D2VLD4_9ASCO|nr:hypothetical protein ASCRUDRAFT_134647 [Ascoidea rubescens DSM 1968]ODV62393.1 hypothetical protein ASCRUDRAFT_134647 [Ascoidea rubescens DSM 1968]
MFHEKCFNKSSSRKPVPLHSNILLLLLLLLFLLLLLLFLHTPQLPLPLCPDVRLGQKRLGRMDGCGGAYTHSWLSSGSVFGIKERS